MLRGVPWCVAARPSSARALQLRRPMVLHPRPSGNRATPRAPTRKPMSEPTSRVTAEQVARYDRPGPRYTSYPTAVSFHEGFTRADYAARLAQADAHADEPLSLYAHLPFCQERCLYCGCNVIITPHMSVAAPYLDQVVKE